MTLSNSTTDAAERSMTDFSKIKVGLKTLEDAVIELGDYRKANPRLSDKAAILQAINNNDIVTMREVSAFLVTVNLGNVRSVFIQILFIERLMLLGIGKALPQGEPF